MSLHPQIDFQAQYDACRNACGLAIWPNRSLIELTGEDRAKFLHSFCTNDINGLQPGTGCELFITDVKGKTLGYGIVLCLEDALVLETAGGQADTLITHLDRYLLREKVTIADRSQQWTQLLTIGPKTAEIIQAQFAVEVPPNRLEHRASEVDGHRVVVYHTDFFGSQAFGFFGPPAVIESVARRIAVDAIACDQKVVDTLRLEAGTPWFGRDITADHLPQEVHRDERAISFAKGCYLGQETVARIDALGHVNRILCGVRFATSDIPPPGTTLKSDGKEVGAVTSAAFSPQLKAALALAYLRRGKAQPGQALDSDAGVAEVIALPVIS